LCANSDSVSRYTSSGSSRSEVTSSASTFSVPTGSSGCVP
jgi:hypothetical protein